MRAARQHLRDPAIVRLCAAALLLMGGFVAVYNYLTYRLTQAPFQLPKSLIGLIFLAYLAGTITSGLAGGVAARIGRRRTMHGSIVPAVAGLALTLPAWLPGVLAGLVVFTTGFFGCHATASAWVTTRARTGKSARVRAVPDRLLRRVQHRRHPHRRGLDTGRLDRHRPQRGPLLRGRRRLRHRPPGRRAPWSDGRTGPGIALRPG